MDTYVQGRKRYYFFPCVSFFSEEHLSLKSFGKLYHVAHWSESLCFMLKPISGKALDQSRPSAVSEAPGLGVDNRWQNSMGVGRRMMCMAATNVLRKMEYNLYQSYSKQYR